MTKELIDLIAQPIVQEYIRLHEHDDFQKLLLKQRVMFGIPTAMIAQQMAGRKKSQHKLPHWYNTRGIAFPPSVNVEQCSSEATGQMKLRLLRSLFKEPPVVADLTGGFGVDTFHLSLYASKVQYVEPDLELLEIVRHNHRLLGISNVIYHNLSAESFLSTNEIPDFLFVDPSRRIGARKVFKLADCEPDITELQSKYFKQARHILIKTSPLLDIKQGYTQIENVKSVHIVAVDNECRELLFHIQPGFSGEPLIQAVDLDRASGTLSECSFTMSEESKTVANFSTPQSFLFEPNVAILKGGAFKWISKKFGISKLAPNTHLYTSNQIVENFPGRIFKKLRELKLDKNLIQYFPKGYANILTRNYPLTVDEIKKKTGLKEGGELYLICTQSEKQKFVMVMERIK